MVVTKHIGRSGNNLFQIAAAIGYARKYGYEWGVDAGSGVGEPYSAIHQVFPNLIKYPLSGTRYHEHPHGHCPIHNRSYDLCHFDYHPIPDIGPNVTLSGFYQSWKYFEGQDEEIKKVFALPHWEEYEDYVSVHVRRGDYLQHAQSFPPVTIDYLGKALDKFNGKGLYRIIVFSDDIRWCKDNFDSILNTEIIKCEFSEGRSERQDLEIMASCRHHIICNSTFSWWGSFLGHNPDRIVISPSCKRGNWFGMESGVKQDCVDLLPPTWQQIEFR